MPETGTGLVERVLALKAIPWLAELQPDDLLPLARVATPVRSAAREPVTVADESGARVVFLVDGCVRARADRRALYEAACSIDLAETLADTRLHDLEAVSDVATLQVPRAQLLEVLEEEFELWRAFLLAICREALRVGAELERESSAAPLAGAGDGQIELADRIVLLRAAEPFREAGVHLLGQIAAEMEPVELEPGACVWKAGEPARGALLVVAGAVTSDAHETAPRALGPGTLLGLADSLGRSRHGYAAWAADGLRALRIDTEALLDVLEDDPETALELLCALGRVVATTKATAAGERRDGAG